MLRGSLETEFRRLLKREEGRSALIIAPNPTRSLHKDTRTQKSVLGNAFAISTANLFFHGLLDGY